MLPVSAKGLEDDSRGESRAFLSHSHSEEVSAGTVGPCDSGEAGGVGPSGGSSGAQQQVCYPWLSHIFPYKPLTRCPIKFNNLHFNYKLNVAPKQSAINTQCGNSFLHFKAYSTKQRVSRLSCIKDSFMEMNLGVSLIRKKVLKFHQHKTRQL